MRTYSNGIWNTPDEDESWEDQQAEQEARYDRWLWQQLDR